MKKTISGIRGVFGDDFNLKHVLLYCGNFTSLIDTKKCVIGRDTRESSHMILETAKAAMLQNGVDVYDLGVVPTPVIFRESRRYGAGIIVTASHNPVNWNGLKFTVNGIGINENQLSVILENQNFLKTKIGSEKNGTTTYIQDASTIIGKIKSQDIVVDLGGGSARYFAPDLLKRLGCKVTTINDTLEKCNRSPDPTSDKLEEISSISHKKIGLAFDLDGDRLVIVKDGKKQAPDVTLGLGIAKSIQHGYKKFVLSVDSSVAIEKFIIERGGRVYRSKVGEANVVDLMLKTTAQAGGEGSSGGFILPEFNYCRDGILAGGLVVSLMEDPKFDEIINHMEKYHQIRRKITISEKHHDTLIEKILDKTSNQFSETSYIDGIKGIIDEDNWILIRKSNTEDVIRVSCESNNPDTCKKNIENIIKLASQHHEKIR